MNEPNVKLKSVTARIDLRAYAGILQYIEGKDMTVSDAIRECVAEKFGSIPLNVVWTDWAAHELEEAISRRQAKREEKRNRKKRSLLRRILSFGGK